MAGACRTGAVAAVCAVGLLATGGAAHAAPTAGDPDDHYTPAGTTIKMVSTNVVFGLPGITVTCTHSTLTGKTPAKGLGAFALSSMTFSDGGTAGCTDTLGYTGTILGGGHWTAQLLDKAGDESSSEPGGGDRLQVTISKSGLADGNVAGCALIFAPAASFPLRGTYSDMGTVTLTAQQLPVQAGGTGCQLQSTPFPVTFSATYHISPTLADGS